MPCSPCRCPRLSPPTWLACGQPTPRPRTSSGGWRCGDGAAQPGMHPLVLTSRTHACLRGRTTGACAWAALLARHPFYSLSACPHCLQIYDGVNVTMAHIHLVSLPGEVRMGNMRQLPCQLRPAHTHNSHKYCHAPEPAPFPSFRRATPPPTARPSSTSCPVATLPRTPRCPC